MTGDRPAGTAFDPSLPHRARQRVARQHQAGRARRGPGLLLAVFAVVYLSVLTSAPRNTLGLGSLVMLALTMAFCLRHPAGDAAAAWARRRYRDQFIGLADLDQPSGQLLLRTQRAIGAVLSSEVHQAGQLDDAANVAVLSAQEWDIARMLRDASRLRAEHGRISAAGFPAAPAVAAVAGPQKEILRQVHEAVTGRVEALEGYAARVRAADGAYRTWQQALALAGLNDGFLDLLARTAADGQAAEEISGLASQARAAEEVFRGTLSDARTAAGPVVLAAPASAGPPGALRGLTAG